MTAESSARDALARVRLLQSVLIKNGRIIDPTGGPAIVGDLLIEDGRIAALGQVPPSAELTIDAQGLLVTPGLIDLHVHFRPPGYEQAETILSGYSQGRFTLLELLDVRGSLLQALLREQEALQNFHIAVATIEGLVGNPFSLTRESSR